MIETLETLETLETIEEWSGCVTYINTATTCSFSYCISRMSNKVIYKSRREEV